jgi:DNA (cytosine-5)-methyltransferase 1
MRPWYTVFGDAVVQAVSGRRVSVEVGRKAMGIDWMNRDELSQAIPPQYTQYVGAQLIESRQLVAA